MADQLTSLFQVQREAAALQHLQPLPAYLPQPLTGLAFVSVRDGGHEQERPGVACQLSSCMGRPLDLHALPLPDNKLQAAALCLIQAVAFLEVPPPTSPQTLLVIQFNTSSRSTVSSVIAASSQGLD